MISQPRENMITILPYSYGYDQRSLRRNGFEYVHAHTLIPDKAMFQWFIIGMRSSNSNSLNGKCCNNPLFHICLGGPASLVSRQTQISASDKKHLIRAEGWG